MGCWCLWRGVSAGFLLWVLRSHEGSARFPHLLLAQTVSMCRETGLFGLQLCSLHWPVWPHSRSLLISTWSVSIRAETLNILCLIFIKIQILKLDSVIRKHVSVFRITGPCESTSSPVYFMNLSADQIFSMQISQSRLKCAACVSYPDGFWGLMK